MVETIAVPNYHAEVRYWYSITCPNPSLSILLIKAKTFRVFLRVHTRKYTANF
jgi:hypothetical protein